MELSERGEAEAGGSKLEFFFTLWPLVGTAFFFVLGSPPAPKLNKIYGDTFIQRAGDLTLKILPDLVTILGLDRRGSLPAHLVRLRVHGKILETSL